MSVGATTGRFGFVTNSKAPSPANDWTRRTVGGRPIESRLPVVREFFTAARTRGRGATQRSAAVSALDVGRFSDVSEVRPVEPPFAVQLLLACHPVESERLCSRPGTTTRRAVLADERVELTVQDVDDFALRLRPNGFAERGAEVVEALLDVGSYCAKCGAVEVVENVDECIGEVLTLCPRIHTPH